MDPRYGCQMTLIPKRRTREPMGVDDRGPLRSERHKQWVRGFRCAGCDANVRCQSAHIRIGTDGSAGVNPSDAWVVPLCFNCHVPDQHQHGERTFWRKVGKNPHQIAIELARKSPDPAVREFARTMVARSDI